MPDIHVGSLLFQRRVTQRVVSHTDSNAYYNQNTLSVCGMPTDHPDRVLMNRLDAAKLRTYIRLNIPVHEVECPAILDLQKPL